MDTVTRAEPLSWHAVHPKPNTAESWSFPIERARGYCPHCRLPIAFLAEPWPPVVPFGFGLLLIGSAFQLDAGGTFRPWNPKPTGPNKLQVPGSHGFYLFRDDGSTTLEPPTFRDLNPALTYQIECPGWPNSVQRSKSKRRSRHREARACGRLLAITAPPWGIME